MSVLRQHWRNLLRIVVSLGALTFILANIGLQKVVDTFRHADPLLMGLAFLLVLVGMGVRAVRWRTLLQALEIQVPLRRLIELYFVGTFFNAFLPSGLGGDVVRVLELTQDTPTAAAVGTVVVDRMTGLLMLFALALGALPFGAHLLPAGVASAIGLVAAGGLVAGGLVLQGHFLRRWGRWLPGPLSLEGQGALARAYRAVTDCGGRAVAQALGVSLLFNLLLISVNYLVARAVGVEIAFTYFFLFVPFLSITLTLPVSIGGLGVREGVAVVLFTQAGVEEAAAVAASLGVYLVSTVLAGLVGGLIYLARGARGLGRRGASPDPTVTNYTN